MRFILRNIIRKSRGGAAVKEQIVDAEILLAGRGNDCGVHLPDPRVLLHHAEFTLRKGELYVAPASGADLRVNDNITQMIRLAKGDVVKIGPYDLIVEVNNQQGEVVLSVELVLPLDNDMTRIAAQSNIQTGHFSIRALSWGLALFVAVTFFTVPWVMSVFPDPGPQLNSQKTPLYLTTSTPTAFWSSGDISTAHRFFGEACKTCHVTPFIPVTDGACLSCHKSTEHHADPLKFQFASFEGRACQSCHKEHQGNRTIALSHQEFCAECHQDFNKNAPKSDLLAASDFGTAHPDFKPTLVIDSAIHQVERSQFISASPPPREDSSLDFPHDRHLRVTGVRDPVRGNIKLDCKNCHETDSSGAYMLPISFDKHCHQCHALKFDIYVPDRELMHGKPKEMFKQVSDVYDAIAMRGGYEEPESPPLIRRRPGVQLTEVEKKEALDWAASKTSAILNGRFGKGQCDSCHKIFETPASGGPTGTGWGVEPVSVANAWFPKSRFTHNAHRDTECTTCHRAQTSTTSADVLMPSIATCRTCHGGEHATNKVPSTCISCHGFHRKELDPMKQVVHASGVQPMSTVTKP